MKSATALMVLLMPGLLLTGCGGEASGNVSVNDDGSVSVVIDGAANGGTTDGNDAASGGTTDGNDAASGGTTDGNDAASGDATDNSDAHGGEASDSADAPNASDPAESESATSGADNTGAADDSGIDATDNSQSESVGGEQTGTGDAPNPMPVRGGVIASQAMPEYCLAVEDENFTSTQASVSLAACSDAPGQRWLVKADGTIHTVLDESYCLIAQSLDHYGTLALAPCEQSLQHWALKEGALVQGNWAIDLDRANLEVVIYSYHGNANQRWQGPFEDLANTQAENGSTAPENENTGQENSAADAPKTATSHTVDGGWSYFSFESLGDYTTYTLRVPAAQNWVNAGLYVEKGATIEVSAEGSWKLKGDAPMHGPEGYGEKYENGCKLGSLVVRIGLAYKDPLVGCAGKAMTYTAPRAGVVFVGGIVSNDLGESYETRARAEGAINVTVSAVNPDGSRGKIVPTIEVGAAANFPYGEIESGWVEVLGKHTLLHLPASIAQQDASEIADAIKRLDDIYTLHVSLRGKRPQHGQPIRWYPDTEDAPGWMLAGNPVRMDPALVYANNNDRITRAARAQNGNWGFAHELGHDFNFAGGTWYYATKLGIEVWPNIFSVHAQEMLNLPKRDLDCPARKQKYLAGNDASGLTEGTDPWAGLCFLMEFQTRYGWDFYRNFYAELDREPGSGWGYLRQKFSLAAGENVDAIFNEWLLPQN
ncbi:M60 family metallopeptidase [Simiduia sp. 21SJ11W-1]|uniref:M60 family metallopeptidase n=1 Tax=Simiduia sp. 21SJ11W-1 TaxID=2909669 RepID=UPI0020A2004F|nr:M60 family metallopeptidase [Simiduia sp. 21SJ11W-1]UTA46835.1 M60 family metallopeptidase [Simiduia sp. 21SJ11W-1]